MDVFYMYKGTMDRGAESKKGMMISFILTFDFDEV